MKPKKTTRRRLIYKWTRPEYLAFLRSGKQPAAIKPLTTKASGEDDDCPSAGNYWDK